MYSDMCLYSSVMAISMLMYYLWLLFHCQSSQVHPSIKYYVNEVDSMTQYLDSFDYSYFGMVKNYSDYFHKLFYKSQFYSPYFRLSPVYCSSNPQAPLISIESCFSRCLYVELPQLFKRCSIKKLHSFIVSLR